MNKQIALLAGLAFTANGTTIFSTVSNEDLATLCGQHWPEILADPAANKIRQEIKADLLDYETIKISTGTNPLVKKENQDLCNQFGQNLLNLLNMVNKKELAWHEDKSNSFFQALFGFWAPQLTQKNLTSLFRATVRAMANMEAELAKELDATIARFVAIKTSPAERSAYLNPPAKELAEDGLDRLMSAAGGFASTLVEKLLPIPPIMVLLHGIVRFFSNLFSSAPSPKAIANSAANVFAEQIAAVAQNATSKETDEKPESAAEARPAGDREAPAKTPGRARLVVDSPAEKSMAAAA